MPRMGRPLIHNHQSSAQGGVTPPSMLPRISGNYYSAPSLARQGTGDQAIGADLMHAIPFPVSRGPETFDRIAISVSTGGGGGAKIRLAIYNDSNGRPGSLVLDAGEVDVTSTGYKAITISQELETGWYWLCFLCNDATVRVMMNASPVDMSHVGWESGEFDTHGLRVSQTYGAAPDPAPTFVANQSRQYIVALRKE
ncbi:hypothetical protein LCGC14_1290030 [marine sediment metagenome]|uniref:Uncharacterized protein n=1 Tax=marine sediment metagenome TaxID=412755 RepID=A0A0F9LDN4_9ZZZZ